MNGFALFFAGAFLCNCLPHLSCGLRGAPFPTPFAKPHGVGLSSPLVNFLWGAFNLLLGVYILASCPLVVGLNPDFAALAIGFLALGAPMSLHFGKMRRDRQAQGEPLE